MPSLRGAALWYDERRPGLGDEFISEISASLDRMRDAPESYPAWPGTRAEDPLIRKATTQRFPYVIAFEKHEHHVLACLLGLGCAGLSPTTTA